MATDVQILTAAREMAAAVVAKKTADAAKLEADRVQVEAARKCEEALKRVSEAQGRLIALSSAKPSEPAPRVEVKAEAPKVEPVKAPEPKPVPPALPAAVPNLSAPRREARHVPPARTGH